MNCGCVLQRTWRRRCVGRLAVNGRTASYPSLPEHLTAMVPDATPQGTRHPSEEQEDSRTWSRRDKGVQKFVGVGSGAGGPVWDTVWKRSTYNDDTGELISDELIHLYKVHHELVTRRRTCIDRFLKVCEIPGRFYTTESRKVSKKRR
eukprot:1257023-Amphidinium_carterae.1